MLTCPAENIMVVADVLERLRPCLESLGITRVWLHGSRAVDGGWFGSDWDLMLEFTRLLSAEEYWGLKAALVDALGGTVDLTSPQLTCPEFIVCVKPESPVVFVL